MLKYGLPAKGIELMCFKPVSETLMGIYPDTDTEKRILPGCVLTPMRCRQCEGKLIGLPCCLIAGGVWL